MFNIYILTFHFLLDVSLAFSDFKVVLYATDKIGRVWGRCICSLLKALLGFNQLVLLLMRC